MAGRSGQLRDETRQVAAQQRFAAGQPHAVDAEAGEHIDERADLLEREQVGRAAARRSSASGMQ